MVWNIHGVLNAVAEGERGASAKRSPYEISIIDFIEDYSFNAKRIEILFGLLGFRKRLYDMGCNSGFQWINGSFCEDCERLRKRPPNDIDIVTFLDIPENFDFMAPENSLFQEKANNASQYYVDSYFMELGVNADASYIQQVAYWYSLWSHQKDTDLWKGFLSIRLSPEEDLRAMEILDSKIDENGEENESESI